MKERYIGIDRELTIQDVVNVARNGYRLEIGDNLKTSLREHRSGLVELAKTGRPIYGFNTGFGSLKDVAIDSESLKQYQRRYIGAHSCGSGRPFPPDVIRAAILLRIKVLSKAYSGVRWELVSALTDLLNADIVPIVPEHGSLGASGDLVPLATIGATLIGEPQAKVWYGGKKLTAPEALHAAGLQPLELEEKEAMALTNGSTVTLAVLCLAVHDAERLTKNADVVASLSLEAVRAELAAYDPRIHNLRPHPGQVASAENIRRLTEASEWMTDEARQVRFPHDVFDSWEKPRVQEAYSLRCIPQVHGAVRDALDHVRATVVRESNSVTDNPLVFADEVLGYVSLSGGNFHGQHLAFVADYLGLSIPSIANISDRRTFRLLTNWLSNGLQPDLAGAPLEEGNSGLMITQYAGASLLARNRILAHPASVDTVPTASDQEDHVSMSMEAAMKCGEIISNARRVLAIEYLAAGQAVSLAKEYLHHRKLGKGTNIAYETLRSKVPPLVEDRFLMLDIDHAEELLSEGVLLHTVEGKLGSLS